MNKQQTMEAYEPPVVEVIEVEVEQGFAGSPISITGGDTVYDDMGGAGGGSYPW